VVVEVKSFTSPEQEDSQQKLVVVINIASITPILNNISMFTPYGK
jgi:hypothetical protein